MTGPGTNDRAAPLRRGHRAAWRGGMAICLILPAAATAQTARIEQIPTAPPPSDAAIAPPNALPPAQISTPGKNELLVQVSRDKEGRTPVAQVNRERRSTRMPAQLAPIDRNAQAAAPLSSPLQSKPGGVVRVGGRDHCDPAKTRRPADCARVIETRSGEFTRSNPLTLSAEQRLLVDQRLRDLPATAEGAVQRIGRNDVDASATDAQSIASLVLPPAIFPNGKSTTDASANTDATTASLGDAEILNVIQGLVGGTPTVTGPPR